MNLPNIWLFILSIVLTSFAVISKYRNKNSIAILMLMLAGFAIRLFAAHLDAFLNVYDERYHAIVARNMMDNPFKPYFRLPYVPYDYKYWGGNYIWVHKQPLFLWQIALSLKLFGISEYAVRYPDVLMGTIMIWLVYRITLLLSKDDTTAFIAAMFMAFSFYQLDLTSAHKGMDHNDVAFAFYVLCSFWAYSEYLKNGKWEWVFLIGIFTGCAVLNKWLTGLLVFSAWGLNILFNIKNGSIKKEAWQFIMAFIISVIVFLPWQLYILHTFPVEAKYEYSQNAKHLTEAVEGARGNESHYLRRLNLYFGYAFPLAFVGLIFIFKVKEYSRKMIITIVSAVLIIFLFFSLIVHSKVDSFMFMIVPMGFVLMAVAVTRISHYLKLRMGAQLALACVATFLALNYFQIADVHNPNSDYVKTRVYNTNIYKTFRKTIPKNIFIVMNVKEEESADCMFFNKGITAYHYCLSEYELSFLRKKKIPIAVFEEHYNYPIPRYIKNYPWLYIIKMPLK